mgnify:CR=1|jgi:hypothetical protein
MGSMSGRDRHHMAVSVRVIQMVENERSMTRSIYASNVDTEQLKYSVLY